MSTPPSKPVNKYLMHKRVEDVEKVAANCDTAIRELTDRFNRLPPRGETGLTGPKGDSIVGAPGRDGRDGKDSTVPGRDGKSIIGPKGESGRDGKDAPDASIYRNECLERDRTIKALRSDVDALRNDFDLLVQALTGQFTKNQDYIAFLMQRAADRIAAGNVQK